MQTARTTCRVLAGHVRPRPQSTCLAASRCLSSASTAPTPTRRSLDLRELGGVRHSVLDFGGKTDDSPTVLFLHANSLCAGVWGPVVQRMSKPVHAVAVDLRAHGDSDAPTDPQAYDWKEIGKDFARIAARIVEETGRPLDACVTHSFIGDCAMMALADGFGAEHVKRMILLDPVLADEWGATVGAQKLAKGTRKLGGREAEGFSSEEAVGEALEKLLKGATVKGCLHPDAKAAFAKYGAAPDSSGKWRLKCNRDNEAEVYAKRVAISEWLQSRRVPTDVKLVFSQRRRGKPDPEEQATLFGRDMQVAQGVVRRCGPGSSIKVMDGVGHFLVLEEPARVANTLDALV